MSCIRFISLFLCWVVLASGAGAETWTEEFAQDPGAPEGWNVVTPDAVVESEQLVLSPAGAGSPAAFAGTEEQGVYFDRVNRIAFDIAYPGETTAWPYDHGGIIFCAEKMSGRYSNSCYVIDYLANAPDDNSAGRFRLAKFVNGTEIGLTQADNITEYEGRFEIVLSGSTITFSFDGVEQFSYDDPDFRGGYLGFWCYNAPAENQVTIDNVEVDHTPADCPVFSVDDVVLTEGKANALAPVRIPFGANDTDPYEVPVTSMDPAVAEVVNANLVFDAGAPRVQNVEIQGIEAGETLLSLDAPPEECKGITLPVQVLAPVAYEEQFSQPDGPPEGWYVASDTAEVVNEELSLHAPGQPFCWYGVGGEPVNVPKMDSVSFKVKFADAAMPVGAHGGMILAPQATAARDRGYMIDVIERESDNGYRIYKDNAPEPGLVTPRPPFVRDDDWHTWEVDFTSTGFVFSVDGEQLAEVEDLAYRGGYLALWCYTGAEGQNMSVDDIQIEFGSSACPAISPSERETLPGLETTLALDAPFGANAAGDYSVSVTSNTPGVALPVGAEAGTLVVDTFPQSDTYAGTSFNVEALAPGSSDFELAVGDTTCLPKIATVSVLEPTYFSEDFAQADGPPENWSIIGGDWQVSGEKLVLDATGGGEKWIYAGAPPVEMAARKISFTLEASHPNPEDPIGRHAGVMFCAGAPIDRWQTSGYEFDWIDREEDRGYRLTRFDNGVQTILAPPTGDQFDLGTEWEIEFAGTKIRLTVDGQLIAEVEDVSYRGGYFGFWAFGNGGHFEIDNVEVGEALGTPFKRGDTNADGTVDLSDAVCVLDYLFGPQNAPCKENVTLCFDAADANDEGKVDLSDGITILGYLFGGEGPLPAPFGECGLDETEDDLGCESYGACK